MKTGELINLNNDKRRMLNEENLKAYEKVLMYLRLEWRLNEHATEELLNDLIDHLLEAQDNGITTEEFFGQDLETFSKELVEELPQNKKRNSFAFLSILTIIPLAPIFLVEGISKLIATFLSNSEPMDIGAFIFSYIIMITLFIITLKYLILFIQRDELKPEHQQMSSTKLFLILWPITSIIIGVYVVINVFVRTPYTYMIPWYVFIIASILIMSTVWTYFKKIY